MSKEVDYKQLAKNLAKENAELKLRIGCVSGSFNIDEIKKAIHKFKKEELPDAESPYHFEAEIWSGMKSFLKWLESNDR
jgi:pyruvate-formate lyase-activating enzyme